MRAQAAGKWIFGHNRLAVRPKCCKNDCPPGPLAKLSSPIFMFGMGQPPTAALVAASQVFASGSISGIFGPNRYVGKHPAWAPTGLVGAV